MRWLRNFHSTQLLHFLPPHSDFSIVPIFNCTTCPTIMSSISQSALQNLDESSRKDILKFIESENSKSKVQMSIHNFTDMCFKKCNANKQILSNGLDQSEEQCLTNCLNRYLDTNIKVVEALQGQR